MRRVRATVQATDQVPLKSVARGVAYAKLQSRLSATDAVQGAKLHHEMPPEPQAVMLSAGEQALARTGRPCTKPPTEALQNAQWRMATAQRLGATPDAGPRSAQRQ